jgi:hypothetical protein
MPKTQTEPMTKNIDPILPHTRAELYQLLSQGLNRGICRSIAEVKADCLAPIPADYISYKPVFSKGSKQGTVPYLAWTDGLFILDYLNPCYSYKLTDNQISDRAVVTAQLILHCKERDIVIEALGSQDLADTQFGGALMDASAQALRRCLATLGLGRYLYYENDRPSQQMEKSKSQIDSLKDESVGSLGNPGSITYQLLAEEKVTLAQLKRLYAIARNAEVSNDKAKEIIRTFGYQSSKDIRQKDYDSIILSIDRLRS